mmetsp:Transcript_13329/g.26259  ORF Transcript_13329/g.26259 Transcript_13329/m.26259 type:complete len:288 (-) Transcript_13329:49-912(-)|eukprot:CAMPEP_0173404586 /NCGR_PEP_ID=MMETSP1356-20130122/59749_1 /TAXON_ID=77927 ORGANISM="Hemiselmis virescens, Strain PCC157" /NCGR_SAMPLE_ID=MMETSP1356 /ASSEMBLY_ACC=CAM_ASM_000847 /LENGTH=287 /DNA_ID=CAMNT_0014365285 /DNA_START=69 /DNA_END=932 /DNA_ORIENTATION=+
MANAPLSVSMEQVRKHLEDLGYSDVPPHVLADFTAELAARVSESAVCDELRGGAAVGGQRVDKAQPLRPRTASEANRTESRGATIRKRGTRLSDKAAERVPDVSGDASDLSVQATVVAAEEAPARSEPASRVRREASASGSVCSVRSTTSFIRPHSASSHNKIKRCDPVAAYQRVREEWMDCPSVTGARKQAVQHVASTAKPRDKPIWKSQHPLDNSEGTDLSYVVPSSKPRVKEMCEVRASLKWNEVYKPHKTDRVYANEAVRAYVTPDEKRRDDIRWHTRVMMNS